MAFLDTVDDNGYKHNFYNVSKAVGNFCPNAVEDVMLVQFFLDRFYSQNNGMIKPQGKLVVDGVFGPVTRNWILKFQMDLKKTSTPGTIFPDAIVNRAATGHPKSSISHSIYTIILLNDFVQTDSIWYNSLAVNPDVPPQLRPVFRQRPSQQSLALAA